MLLFSPAKINLGLRVIGKRSDGYHELESILLAIDLEDAIEITPSKTFEIVNHGIQMPKDITQNLMFKAWELLDVPPVKLEVIKRIPLGGGLGGGSSNAVTVLKGLNDMFEKGLQQEELEKYALELGSDCPFFIKAEPSFATGRGEVLSSRKFNLEGYFYKIKFSPIHISTPEAFALLDTFSEQGTLAGMENVSVNDWKWRIKNDFEEAIYTKYPQLHENLESLKEEGAVFAQMTGTGATVYGIFSQRPQEESGSFIGKF